MTLALLLFTKVAIIQQLRFSANKIWNIAKSNSRVKVIIGLFRESNYPSEISCCDRISIQINEFPTLI